MGKHLSIIFGVGPITVSKYWESGDANQDGSVGVGINLSQDNTIQGATGLSNLKTT